MSVMIPMPVDTVTGRAVLKIVEIFFDFLGKGLYYSFFIYDLKRGIADDTTAGRSRVLFQAVVSYQCSKLVFRVGSLQKKGRSMFTL